MALFIGSRVCILPVMGKSVVAMVSGRFWGRTQ